MTGLSMEVTEDFKREFFCKMVFKNIQLQQAKRNIQEIIL